MSLNVPLLRSSFEQVVERSPGMTARFYEILFERYPQVRPLFGRNSQKNQEEMLTRALVAVIEHLEDPSWLTETLRAMGAKHVTYGVNDEMYPWVAASLLSTLEEVLGADWTPPVGEAWATALTTIAAAMIDGARLASAPSPALP